MQEVERAVTKEKWNEALPPLIALWQKTRSEDVAALIERIGRRTAKGKTPPAGKRVKDVVAEWIERAKKGDPAELDVLLPTLGSGKSPDALAKLTALVKAHDGDPRIGRAFVAMLERPPFQAQTTKPFWKALTDALPAHADGHVEKRLAALEGRMVDVLDGAETMAAILEKMIATARTAIPEPKPVDAEAIARIAALLPDGDAAGDPLEGLDDIAWGDLTDAYGTAEGVPEQIRRIAKGDLDALGQAYGNLCHQGTCYAATVAAAPFLVRLAAVPTQENLFELLRLLAGFGWSPPDHYAISGAGPREKDVKELDAEDSTLGFAGTWRAVVAGLPTYHLLLEHADARIRRAASLLIGLIADGGSSKLLARAISRETDDDTVAMELLALGLIAKTRQTKGELGLFRDYLGHASIAVRAAAAIGIALAVGPKSDKQALGVLRAAAEAPPTSGARWLFFEGNIGKHARAIHASLDLESDEELLADLEKDLDDESLRERKLERVNQLIERFFRGRPRTPKPIFDELPEAERRLLLAATKLRRFALSHWGFFYTEQELTRYVGLAPHGPIDERIDVVTPDGKHTWPIWKIVSDALHAHLDVGAAVDAFAKAPFDVALAALREIVLDYPYGLWRGEGHPDDVDDSYDAQRLHNVRFVALQAAIAQALGPKGEAFAAEVAEAQLAVTGPARYRKAGQCAFATLVLARAAKARGEALSERYDALVAETITTPPAQRTPRITEEILSLLPEERAAAIALAAAPVYRLGRTTRTEGKTRTSWDTIFFDDTLRYLPPSRIGAALVIEAIEEWARVAKQIPKNEPKVDPLPRRAFVDFLVKVGASAQPLIESSKAKKHAAVDVLEEALARMRS